MEKSFVVDTKKTLEIKRDGHIVMQYADDSGNVTSQYPFNPNGSIESIAGFFGYLILKPFVHKDATSQDGRGKRYRKKRRLNDIQKCLQICDRKLIGGIFHEQDGCHQ